MVILSASNNCKYFDKRHLNYSYIENLLVLIKSIKQFHENIKIDATIINGSNNIIFPIEIKGIDVKGSNIEIRNYSGHYRIKKFKDELPKHKYLIWIDADTIVKKSLDNLFKGLEDDEPILKIIYREECSDNARFLSSIICINNTPETIKLVNDWHNFHINTNKNNWFSDQLSLWQAYNINKNIRLIKLDERIYSDTLFGKDSIIWHCKSQYNNEKWIKEYNKFINKNII